MPVNKNQGKLNMPAFLVLLASPVQLKQYTNNVDGDTDEYFLLANVLDCVRFEWNNNYTFFPISQTTSVSSCCQGEFQKGNSETHGWIIYNCLV